MEYDKKTMEEMNRQAIDKICSQKINLSNINVRAMKRELKDLREELLGIGMSKKGAGEQVFIRFKSMVAKADAWRAKNSLV